MISQNFVIVGAVINLLGGLSYIKDTLRGKVRPNRVSWGLWGLSVMVAFAAEIKQGVGLPSLATFMVGFVPLLIFIASFLNKQAYWKLTRFDLLCGLLSLFGLVLWQVTKVDNIAILFSIFADLAAGIPTLTKSFRYPETENWMEFSSSAVSVTLAMLALKSLNFASLAFPLYIFCYDTTAAVLISTKVGKKLSSRVYGDTE